jgi:hypothetical protein
VEKPTWEEWFSRALKMLEEAGLNMDRCSPNDIVALQTGPVPPEAYAVWTTLPQ